MVNKQIKARLKPEDLQEFNRLKVRLGIQDSFTSTQDTINKAVELSHNLLDLKARLKDLFGGLL